MNLWKINEDKFNPDRRTLHSQETVYTIGNGYFCTRGTFEEGYPRENTATLLFGVFDSIPISKEELANAPDWTPLQLFVNGERFRLDRGKILDYQRTLDMRHATIQRTVRWQSPGGIRLNIKSERIASLADEHVGAIRYSVTIEDQADHQDVDVALWSSIEAGQGNYDVLHWETVDQGNQGEIIWLQSETKKTGVQLIQSMSFQTDRPDFHKQVINSDIAPSIRFSGKLTRGATLTAEKIVVMYNSRDVENIFSHTLEHHTQLLAANRPFIFEHLLTAHKEAWLNFWQQADIIIEGDDQAQRGVRYNLYQLRINASSHDSRYSIAAKGMTGFGYRGHIFHDTEIFMLPFFTYVLPGIARLLLLYRYHLLPAARQKAISNGYEGAQYPWESTLDGEETTPTSIVHPETGEVIPVLNGFIELHITASIAHAVWEYWDMTGDDEFMREYGAEILFSTATFWASRAEQNDERGDYEITNVIGPDEWHEHVDNNVYTNYMARLNIQMALSTFDWLQTIDPRKTHELEQQLNLTPENLEHWRDVAEHLRILQDPRTGLFEQFEGFFELEPLDQEQYRGRTDSYQGIIGVEEVQKYRIVKQADVLMLLSVLEQEFNLQTKKVNWDYYYPITDHDYGSSLTPALHTILACELGQMESAYKLFMKGALVDLENLRGNTPEGIHTACAGAVWQAVVLGFAGLRINGRVHTTNPHWPDGWKRLAFKFQHKGQPVQVDLRR